MATMTIWGVCSGLATFVEVLCWMITLIAVPMFYRLVFREKFKLTYETFLMLALAPWYGLIFIISWIVSDLEGAYRRYFSVAEFITVKIREKDAAHYQCYLARKAANNLKLFSWS